MTPEALDEVNVHITANVMRLDIINKVSEPNDSLPQIIATPKEQ